MNISFIFNILRDFSSGSVWELYLLSVMILIALFCNLMSLCVLKPHSKMLLLKCGAISELYMLFRVYVKQTMLSPPQCYPPPRCMRKTDLVRSVSLTISCQVRRAVPLQSDSIRLHSLFITPNVRDILFAILSIYRSQFSVS